jgi:hypothetical protein
MDQVSTTHIQALVIGFLVPTRVQIPNSARKVRRIAVTGFDLGVVHVNTVVVAERSKMVGQIASKGHPRFHSCTYASIACTNDEYIFNQIE